MIPFDEGPESLGSEGGHLAIAQRVRNRRFLTSVGAGFAAKIVSTAAAAIIVSVALRSVGPERYGILATITSFLGLLQLSDLGLGNGLVARLAHARGLEDEDLARQLVTATVLLLVVLALIVTVLAAGALIVVDWPRLLGVGPAGPRRETTAAVAVCLALIAVGLPLGVVQDIQDGLQEGYVSSVWAVVGSVLAVGGVVVCAITKAGLPYLVASVVGGPVLALALNGCALWGRSHPELRPSRMALSRATVRVLFRSGGLFFVLQMAGAVSFETDAIIIARVLGPRQVTNYIIPAALFGFVASAVAIAVSPLWGAYADAIARKDYPWVRATLRRSLVGTAAFTVPVAIMLVLGGPLIIRLWAGPTVHTTLLLLIALGAWAVLGSLGSALAMLLNAAHVVRLQVIAASTMAVTNLGLSIVLARTVGVSGVVLGTVIAYGLCVVVPYAFLVPKKVRLILGQPQSLT